jgi:steroid delta-isomerase-like uncharacterized protein
MDSRVAEQNMALASDYIEAWNDHSLEKVMRLHADESVFKVHMVGAPEARGAEECRAAFGFLLEAWPDQQFDIQEVVAHDGGYVCRSILTGTLARPWNLGGTVIEPRGQRVSFGILDVMTCRDGLIVRKEVWVDGGAMMAALM